MHLVWKKAQRRSLHFFFFNFRLIYARKSIPHSLKTIRSKLIKVIRACFLPTSFFSIHSETGNIKLNENGSTGTSKTWLGNSFSVFETIVLCGWMKLVWDFTTPVDCVYVASHWWHLPNRKSENQVWMQWGRFDIGAPFTVQTEDNRHTAVNTLTLELNHMDFLPLRTFRYIPSNYNITKTIQRSSSVRLIPGMHRHAQTPPVLLNSFTTYLSKFSCLQAEEA